MIYLSFDIEEFDMPKEYGFDIPFERQMSISREGLTAILDLLQKHEAKATFFSTVVFAQNASDLILRLLSEGHELASHTYYHSDFAIEHLHSSKEALESQFGVSIEGLRMPRMLEVSATDVSQAGYSYNSSVNPTFLPGRYNKLQVPRALFREGDLWQIPAAVSPWRIPLFWLSFHNFPLWYYKYLLVRTIRSLGYAALYFHPWEFTNLHQREFNFPSYVMRNTGEAMITRFDKLLGFAKEKNWKVERYKKLIEK